MQCKLAAHLPRTRLGSMQVEFYVLLHFLFIFLTLRKTPEVFFVGERLTSSALEVAEIFLSNCFFWGWRKVLFLSKMRLQFITACYNSLAKSTKARTRLDLNSDHLYSRSPKISLGQNLSYNF